MNHPILKLIVLFLTCISLTKSQGTMYGDMLNPMKLKKQQKLKDDINPLIKKLLELIQQYGIKDSLLYSGKGLNDLGQYDSCIRDDLKFYLLGVPSPFGQAGIGICLEKNTTAQNLTALLQTAVNKYNITALKTAFVIETEKDNTTSNGYITVVVLFSIIAVLTFFALITSIGSKSYDSSMFTNMSKLKILMAFEPIGNLKETITVSQRRGAFNLDFFEGLRVMSTLMVIWGHTYLIHGVSSVNTSQLLTFASTRTFAALMQFQLSVDVFFFLSGFFIAFSFLQRQLPIKTGWIQFIIMRYLRLMPLYFFMIMFYWQIVPRIGDGPIWNLFSPTATSLCSTWWRNTLLIDNYWPVTEKYCFPWGWYLSCDWQMFLISIPPLVIYKYKQIFLAKSVIVFMILFNIGYSTVFNIVKEVGLYNFNGVNSDKYNAFDDVYDAIWQRWAVYYQGLYMGICFIEFKLSSTNLNSSSPSPRCNWLEYTSKKCSQSRLWRVLFYSIGFTLIMTIFFLPGDYVVSRGEWSITVQQFFNVINRPVFILGINIFMLPMITQHSDYLSKMLGCYFFRFMTKLTYPMYLIHYMVLQQDFFSTRQNMYFNNRNIFIIFLYSTVITVFYSVLAQAFIEKPFATLVEMLIPKKKNPIKQKDTQQPLLDDSEQNANLNIQEKEFVKILDSTQQ